MYSESNEERRAREAREIEMMTEQARWRAFMQKINEQSRSGRNSNSTQGAATAAGSAGGGGGSIIHQGDPASKNQTSLVMLREKDHPTFRYYIANYYSEKISGPFDTGVSIEDYSIDDLYTNTILYGGYGLRFFRPDINEHTLIFLTKEGKIVESITAISTDVEMNDYEGKFIVATDYDEDILWVFDGESLLTNTSVFAGSTGFSIGTNYDEAISAGVGLRVNKTMNDSDFITEFYLCNGVAATQIYEHTQTDLNEEIVDFGLYMNLDKLVVIVRDANTSRLKRLQILETNGEVAHQIEIDDSVLTDSDLIFFGNNCFFLHLRNSSDNTVQHLIFNYDGTSNTLQDGNVSAETFTNWDYRYRLRDFANDYNYDAVNNAVIVFYGESNEEDGFTESDQFLIWCMYAGETTFYYNYADGESKKLFTDDEGLVNGYSLFVADPDMSDQLSALVIKAGGEVIITELNHSIIDLEDIDITETKNRIAVVVEYDNIGSPSTNTIVHSFNSAGVKNSDVLELDTPSHETRSSYGTYVINGDNLDSYLSPSGNWIKYPAFPDNSSPNFHVNLNQTSGPYEFTWDTNFITYTHTQMIEIDGEAAPEDFVMDGSVAPGTKYFGQGSNYFTNHYPGLFVLAAKSISIESFKIDGNIGADGNGQVSTTILPISGYSKSYTAYVKQVYDNGDPSINQIIIVDTDGEGIVQSIDESTEDDLHQITGIESATEIHYLLFATDEDSLQVSLEDIEQVITEYLDLVDDATISNTLSILNLNYSNITGIFPAYDSGDPNRIYYFNSVGNNPNSIEDGGDDMYDDANFISTGISTGLQCRIFKENGSVATFAVDNFDDVFAGRNRIFTTTESINGIILRQYDLNGTLIDQVNTGQYDYDNAWHVENRGMVITENKTFDGIDVYINSKIYMISKKGISNIEVDLYDGDNTRIVHNDYGWLNFD